jgi:electron transfer flavoprotein beta subunit
VWGVEDLKSNTDLVGLNGSPTQVMKIFSPPKPEGGKVFTGEPVDSVKALLKELRDGGIQLGVGGEKE